MKESQWGPAWVLSALYTPAVPFQKNVLPPCSSGKCHAILSVWEELQHGGGQRAPALEPTGGWAFSELGIHEQTILFIYIVK